jgi:hypothetical protein
VHVWVRAFRVLYGPVRDVGEGAQQMRRDGPWLGQGGGGGGGGGGGES